MFLREKEKPSPIYQGRLWRYRRNRKESLPLKGAWKQD